MWEQYNFGNANCFLRPITVFWCSQCTLQHHQFLDNIFWNIVLRWNLRKYKLFQNHLWHLKLHMIYLKALNKQSHLKPFHIIIMADSTALRNRAEGIWITRSCSYLAISNVAVLFPSTWKMGRFGGRTFSFWVKRITGTCQESMVNTSWSRESATNRLRWWRWLIHTHTHTHIVCNIQINIFPFYDISKYFLHWENLLQCSWIFPVHRIHWHNKHIFI